MESVILVVHVLAAVAIIALILLQQGKGAEAGASFGGGASQTVFGSAGGGNFFTRATAILATIFFITSFGLAVVAKQKAGITDLPDMPSVEFSEEVPAAVEAGADEVIGDIPQAETSVKSAAGDIPAAEIPATE
ncbi:MAG: preprotein translocase subunit SecG [Candidatus Pelagadaptatus aseana]|uniref:preprotein translocase subunit SecG n=1 Tax=Candidatus Pelagadaptatus aseana TaxID=3120508 RepID=UPI0039B1856E